MIPAILPVDFLPWGLLIGVLGLYLAGVLILIAAGRRTDARALGGFVPDCAAMVRRLAGDASTSAAQRIALALGWLLRTHGEDAIRDAWPGPDASLAVILRAAGRG